MTKSFETHTCIACKKNFDRRLKKSSGRLSALGLRGYRMITCSPKCSTTYNHQRKFFKDPNNHQGDSSSFKSSSFSTNLPGDAPRGSEVEDESL